MASTGTSIERTLKDKEPESPDTKTLSALLAELQHSSYSNENDIDTDTDALTSHEHTRCCCGRDTCISNSRNAEYISQLERDLDAAAKVGQALLARHESSITTSENEQARLLRTISSLQAQNRAMEHENVVLISENRNLLCQLEELNSAVAQGDKSVRSLEAALESARVELYRLSLLERRAIELERQMRVLEDEQEKLHDELQETQEDRRGVMQRWKRAEVTIADLETQIERIEMEAKNEKQRHQDVLKRLQQKASIENLAMQFTSSSMEHEKVEHGFVKDILNDNTSLQLGVLELRDLLAESQAEVDKLRGILDQNDNKIPEESPEKAMKTPPRDLASELALIATPTSSKQDTSVTPTSLHVHHHYHRPALRPTPLSTPRRASQRSSKRASQISSTDSVYSSTSSVQLPPNTQHTRQISRSHAAVQRWSTYSNFSTATNTTNTTNTNSSIPSSPGHAPSIFDDTYGQSIDTVLARVRSESPVSEAEVEESSGSSQRPSSKKTERATREHSPSPPPQREDDSSETTPKAPSKKLPRLSPTSPRPLLRRSGSADSVMSISIRGMDIHSSVSTTLRPQSSTTQSSSSAKFRPPLSAFSGALASKASVAVSSPMDAAPKSLKSMSSTLSTSTNASGSGSGSGTANASGEGLGITVKKRPDLTALRILSGVHAPKNEKEGWLARRGWSASFGGLLGSKNTTTPPPTSTPAPLTTPTPKSTIQEEVPSNLHIASPETPLSETLADAILTPLTPAVPSSPFPSTSTSTAANPRPELRETFMEVDPLVLLFGGRSPGVNQSGKIGFVKAPRPTPIKVQSREGEVDIKLLRAAVEGSGSEGESEGERGR